MLVYRDRLQGGPIAVFFVECPNHLTASQTNLESLFLLYNLSGKTSQAETNFCSKLIFASGDSTSASLTLTLPIFAIIPTHVVKQFSVIKRCSTLSRAEVSVFSPQEVITVPKRVMLSALRHLSNRESN